MSADSIREKDLARYFDKDWLGLFAQKNLLGAFEFLSPAYETSHAYCSFHENAIGALFDRSREMHFEPKSLLEVGSSLGRTFFEIGNKFGSIKTAKLIEPSANLRRGFSKIFEDVAANIPLLLGCGSHHETTVDVSEIGKSCSHIDFEIIGESFENANLESEIFDLVVCLNVIDQCHSPLQLIDFIKAKTRKNGILVVSDSYQWPSKHCHDQQFVIENLKDFFKEHSWKVLDERNIEFKLRHNERHWCSFLSHFLILNKTTD